MLIYLRLVATAFLWGGTFVAGRMLTTGLGPYSAAFLRFLVASLCLFWLVRTKEGGLPPLSFKGWIGVSLLGLTGVFAYSVFFFTGLQSVHVGRAAAIVACNPIFIALCAAIFFKEGLSKTKIFGIITSICGAITVISRGSPLALFTHAISWGDAAIFGCVASWVSYSLLGKRMMNNLSPHVAVTFSCLTGTLLLFPFALYEGLLPALPQLTITHFICILYLGVLGTVIGFTWFYEGVKKIGASKAGIFINLVPVTAILLGWFILGEPVHTSLLLGAALVVAGVYVTNKG